jgi:UDP-N-acetyl-D-glucosamine dehydrogenase
MMVNDRMPEYCVERAKKILNRYQKALNGSRILILGIAYKQDIDDYRESPALHVIEILKSEQAEVIYFDPWVSEYHRSGETKKGEPVLSPELLVSVDLVIVTTGHSNVDYDIVQKHAKFIFDTKNAMRKVSDRSNIEVL